jgi:hypothetical protein
VIPYDTEDQGRECAQCASAIADICEVPSKGASGEKYT